MLATREQLAHIAIQAELLAVESRAAIITQEDAAELLRMVSNCLLFLSPLRRNQRPARNKGTPMKAAYDADGDF